MREFPRVVTFPRSSSVAMKKSLPVVPEAAAAGPCFSSLVVEPTPTTHRVSPRIRNLALISIGRGIT